MSHIWTKVRLLLRSHPKGNCCVGLKVMRLAIDVIPPFKEEGEIRTWIQSQSHKAVQCGMVWLMDFRPALIHDSDVPLYRQLFEQIAARIRSGELGRGERLPATRELAGLLG